MIRILTILLFFLSLCLAGQVFGQAKKKVLQFTGVVVSEESENGIPGVHIYTNKGGRGTTTNVYGYFTLPVLSGDSLIISAVSFEKEQIVIPSSREEDLTVVLRLKTDTTYLPELEVYPFPSEELFKEAVLALQLPNQYDLNNMSRNVDQAMLNKIYRNPAVMTAGDNYYYYQNLQSQAYNNRFQANSISLLNPFAWSKFIKSLKKRESE